MLSVLSSITAGAALCDEQGRILMADEAFAAIVGRPLDRLAGLSRAALTHPEDEGRNLISLDRQKADRKPFVITKRYLLPNGASVWVQNRVSKLNTGAYLLLSRPMPENVSPSGAHSAAERLTFSGVVSETAFALAHQSRRFALPETAAMLEQAADRAIPEGSC